MENRRAKTLRLAALLSIAAVCQAVVKDPLNDFCRRFGHQSAVIGNKLYLDGGLVNWNPLPQNPGNFTNTGLLWNDLDTVAPQDGMPMLHAGLNKSASVPSVEGGILWADDVNKKFFLFGGEYQGTPDDFQLWSYDTIGDSWNVSAPASKQIERVAYGAGVAVNESGLAYYYGGWLGNKSVAGWTGPAMATSTLIQYDMVKDQWTNNTGPDMVGRAEGIMVHIPASDGGMLVYFGGISTPFGNETAVGEPMDTIRLYDIANSKWYNQTATGDVPEKRRRFCGGVTWAEDQSSYNIYLYGGMGMEPNTVGFDDVYILSLPSFTWLKWYPTEPGTQAYPHHSLSCNVINGAQMLIIGGSFPTSSACDAPTVWGTHNLNLGKDNAANSQWALFQTNLTKYRVPEELIAKIGGTAAGGATKLEPSGGFGSREVSVYFSRKAQLKERKPTRVLPGPATGKPEKTGRKRNMPTIIGASIGGAAIAGLLALVIFFFLRRLRLKRPPPGKLVELPAGSASDSPYAPYRDTVKFDSKSPGSAYSAHTTTLSPPPMTSSPVHEPGRGGASPVYVQPVPGYYHTLPPVQPYFPPPGSLPAAPSAAYAGSPTGNGQLMRWPSSSDAGLRPAPLRVEVPLPPPVPEKQYEMPSVRTPVPQKRELLRGRLLTGNRASSGATASKLYTRDTPAKKGWI
ncbi:MAG: hypothetical protein M1832_000882 [Thelocarpon impressellum]|nr:MAG: hypothetical protein M1832_000882 [Thelocarpon impressellum]